MLTADTSQPATLTPPADISQVAPSNPTAAGSPADGQHPGQTPTPKSTETDNGTAVAWDVDNGKLDADTQYKLLEQLRNAPSDPADRDPTLPRAPQQNTAAPAPELAPPVGNTPAAPVAEPVIPVVEEIEDLDAGGLEVPTPGDTARHKAIKFRPQSELDAAALRIAKATGKGVTDPATIAAAKASLGIVDTPPPASSASVQDTPPTPSSVTEIDAKIKELREKKKAQNVDFNFDDDLVIEEQIDALKEQKFSLREQGAQQATQQEQQFQQTWTQSSQRAAAMFPDAAKSDSPLMQRAAELQAQAQQNNDPRYHDPRSALFFVQEAAFDLGIAPVTVKPAAAPAAAPVPPQLSTSQPSVRPPGSVLISGGSQQSTQQRMTTDSDAIDQISTPEELQAFQNQLSGVHYHSQKF